MYMYVHLHKLSVLPSSSGWYPGVPVASLSDAVVLVVVVTGCSTVCTGGY